MSNDPTLSCQCGSLTATLRGASGDNGNHGMCYCLDCQAFARHLGQLDRIANAAGGTEIFQTQPHRIAITSGIEHLALLRLSKKGINRWFASCCNTPLCTTPGPPKVAFAGMLVANITASQTALGPIRFRYKRESALQPVKEPQGSALRFVARTFASIAAERLSGRWKDTPLFGADGRSIVKPYVLSASERTAAYTR